MNLTGKWSFIEEFISGIDKGEADLIHDGEYISGVLIFTESIEGDIPFKVKCILSGRVEGLQVTLNVDSFEIIESETSIEYYGELRTGIINGKGQIVGSSEDEQGVEGVFVFTRI